IANQIVGPGKLGRLARLAKRARVRVCVDDAGNVAEMASAARQAGATIEVLVEVDIGMARCGGAPGEPPLAREGRVQAVGLGFVGLHGYDGPLQMRRDAEERRARCVEGLDRLLATRRLIEQAGLPAEVVSGAGTGTWEFAARHEALTELQPGS